MRVGVLAGALVSMWWSRGLIRPVGRGAVGPVGREGRGVSGRLTSGRSLLTVARMKRSPRGCVGSMAPPVFVGSLRMFSAMGSCFSMSVFGSRFCCKETSGPAITVLRGGVTTLRRNSETIMFSTNVTTYTTTVLGVYATKDRIVYVGRDCKPMRRLLSRFLDPGCSMAIACISKEAMGRFRSTVHPRAGVVVLRDPAALLFGIMSLRKMTGLTGRRKVGACVSGACSAPVFRGPLSVKVSVMVRAVAGCVNKRDSLMNKILISGSRRFVHRVVIRES